MNGCMSFLKVAFAVCVASLALACHALTIDQYYTSDAVLQRGVTLPVSGTVNSGATVTVSFAGASASATADANGRWSVALPPKQAGGPYVMSVSDGTQTLTATNMMVGEVWLVSGQSNAFYPIERFDEKEDWLTDADYSSIRFIMTTKTHFQWHLNPDSWQVATPETVGKCSATGFFFAKELQKTVDVPIGVVVAAVDGSIISSWQTDGDNFKNYMENSLEPLVPFPFKGVIWYQGESDGMFARGYDYRFQLQKLIRNWRMRWNHPEMPFLVVQLPHYNAYELWYEVRDSQNWVATQETGVYVVPTLDIGDLNNIHPPRKPELGQRLSVFARKYVYGESGLYPEGPIYRSAEVQGNEMFVHFDVHSAITSSDGQPLKGFTVGGEAYGQLKFYEATVRIVDTNTVAVSSANLQTPLGVRYGFSVSSTVNFYDAAGNPAGAFRSDTFKLPTQSADAHEHGWKLTASGSVLTAVCTNANCTAGTPTFAIGGATTKAYDGTPLAATLEGTDFAAKTTASLGLLEYDQGSTKLSGAPVEVGTYGARVEVEHEGATYVLTRALTITPAQDDPPPVDPPAGDPAGAIAASGDATGADDYSAIQAAIDAAARPTRPSRSGAARSSSTSN